MKKTPPMKRFLSFMLALVMVLTMVPANGIHVHAHDSETAQTETTPEIPAEQQEQEQTDTPAEEVVVETVIGPETSALAPVDDTPITGLRGAGLAKQLLLCLDLPSPLVALWETGRNHHNAKGDQTARQE